MVSRVINNNIPIEPNTRLIHGSIGRRRHSSRCNTPITIYKIKILRIPSNSATAIVISTTAERNFMIVLK
jgi:hypothetical protein